MCIKLSIHLAVWAGGLENEEKQINTESIQNDTVGTLFCAA